LGLTKGEGGTSGRKKREASVDLTNGRKKAQDAKSCSSRMEKKEEGGRLCLPYYKKNTERKGKTSLPSVKGAAPVQLCKRKEGSNREKEGLWLPKAENPLIERSKKKGCSRERWDVSRQGRNLINNQMVGLFARSDTRRAGEATQGDHSDLFGGNGGRD